MRYSLNLGKIAGIKIQIHWTFLLLILWIVMVNLRANATTEHIIWSIIFILAVFGCVVLHELGHAITGKSFKVVTSSITLLPIGGIAKMEDIPEKPKAELAIALAGPAVNVLIAILLFLVTGVAAYSPESLNLAGGLGPQNFLPMLMIINVWLALFNLIPALPMDGGRVFRALLAFKFGHVKATRIAAAFGQFLAILFVFFGFFYNPFLIIIGLFIFLGAQSESIYAETKSILHGFTINDVLMHQIPYIDKNSSVKEAVDQLLNTQNKHFVVTDGGVPVGTLSSDEIIRALQEKGDNARVDDVKNQELAYLADDTPLEQVWSEMQRLKKRIILVGNNGVLKGIVDEDNLTEFILIRSARTGNY